MLYEEAIEAEWTGERVLFEGHKYRVIGHKAIGNSGHFTFTIQRIVLGVPYQPIEIGEQTLACLRRAKQ